MIEPPPPPASVPRPREDRPDGDITPPESPAAPTTPRGPRLPFDGRARTFRRKSAERRSARRERLGEIFVVAIVLLGVYAVVTARPYSPSSVYVPPPVGPTIVVHLGTPSVRSITCGDGGKAYAERISWVNASLPITTGDVAIRVYEIWDGDFIGDPTAAPNVSGTSLCAGPTPSPGGVWYVVLADPNGTNLLTYTVDQGWRAVAGGPWNFEVADGSDLYLVMNPSLAASGRGFQLFGFANGSPILGSTPL